MYTTYHVSLQIWSLVFEFGDENSSWGLDCFYDIIEHRDGYCQKPFMTLDERPDTTMNGRPLVYSINRPFKGFQHITLPMQRMRYNEYSSVEAAAERNTV